MALCSTGDKEQARTPQWPTGGCPRPQASREPPQSSTDHGGTRARLYCPRLVLLLILLDGPSTAVRVQNPVSARVCCKEIAFCRFFDACVGQGSQWQGGANLTQAEQRRSAHARRVRSRRLRCLLGVCVYWLASYAVVKGHVSWMQSDLRLRQYCAFPRHLFWQVSKRQQHLRCGPCRADLPESSSEMLRKRSLPRLCLR